MTERLPCPPAPGPLEEYATRFDPLFATLAQRRDFRAYLHGLLLPRERNKTLTGLAGAEPTVGAQHPAVQALQLFLSESTWAPRAINDRRLELLLGDPATAPHEQGALVIDDTGDRKAGRATAHVARQYLGSVGKVDNGIVAVSSLWADERIYYPLHVEPYTPASRLPRGDRDPAFRTKPRIAVELVAAAVATGVPFRAVVADCAYGDSAAFQDGLGEAELPYVLALKPSTGTWAPAEAAHSPEEAARRLRWDGPREPGDWTPIERRFRDGHRETWWAAELRFGGYGPDRLLRLVAATTDPAALPGVSTWYLATNLPAPGALAAESSPFPPADLAELVRLYGLRDWVEQGYKQVKQELGWADFMVRADHAIRRHWQLVCCAFSFCWRAWFQEAPPPEPGAAAPPGGLRATPGEDSAPVPAAERGENRDRAPARRRLPCRPVAGDAATGARVAGALDVPAALVAGLVHRAPAPGAASAPRHRPGRPAPAPLSPRITNYR
jgi:hypothetical protein